ncbi:hypothetical protein ALC60_13809 [Trachymyrmex zeteki]|uniref:Uncharacterized protein n=2 Tax=Mycetomoellerius zeteki TaxID=64791 RepID=A0A151WH86_9HYME|nr:hypothetical protein ALC60_13809 [Trachymyrmex zeteki]
MDNDSMNFHNIVDSTEHDYKLKKSKESMLLLKQKIIKTDVLIKQYTQNMKEVENLKSSLEVAKKEAIHMISDYSSAKDEIRELKCKIVEYEQSNEKLINKISDYDINIAADKQSIQQLTCKIKELEEEQSAKIMEYDLEKSSFEDKIKELEHELKTLKKNNMQTVTKKGGKKKEKKIISTDVDTAKPSISIKSTSDIGINVSLCNIESSVKCEVRDQNIMTDEFYHMKNDPHPLFCAKCEAHLSPELTPEKIFKTMVACPKLIEKDLPPSPKKIYSPPCSLSSTYPGFTNRNEDSLSKISPIPHLRPYSPCSDSIAGNIKSGRSSTMTQICENVELRNTDISHRPFVANIPSNFNAIPTLSQNRNCAREHFCSDDLLIKHSISLKKMKRKIRSLKSKMKKFRRLKEKIDTNSRCRCVMNHKDDISLNSNLISSICKGVAEYFNEKKETCSKNELDIDSEMCICCSKRTELKKRQSCNAYESMFSKIENFDENERVRDTCCDKTENATKITDILQFNHTSKNILSSVHKNNSYSNINISSTSLNDIEIDKEFLPKQNTLHSLEVASVEDNLTTSRLSVDKLYVSNDILNKDNVDANDVDNQTETGCRYQTETMSLSNDKKSSDHADGKTVDINTEENKIKTKNEIIHKDKSSEICANDNISSKDNINDIDMDNQKIGMISLFKDEDFSDYTNDKTVDINVEENKIERKNQSVHKNQVDEIYISDDLLSNNTIKAINIQTETRNISNTENFDNSKIVDINTESEMKRKSQSTHNDKISEIYASNDLFGKNNVKAIDMNNRIEAKTIFLSDDTNSIHHAYRKIIDVNAEENKIKTKDQNINEDKINEIHASDNLLSKSNVETTDTDNQTETRTILLSNNKNSTVGKIVDINADKIEIKGKGQNIYKDEIDKINTSGKILSQDNIEAVDMDSQTKTRMASLFNNENSTDLAHSKSVINVEKRNIIRKGQNIQKAKIGDRLLKNLRNLKRKKQPISCINKQENIELYSDHNIENLELAKKSRIENEEEINDSSLNHIKNLKRNVDTPAESINKQTDDKLCSNHYEPKKIRIAHTPKTPVHQLSINRNNSTHCTIRNIAILTTSAIRQKNNVNQQLNTHKDNSLIESKKNPITNKKRDEENVVKSIEISSIDERPVNEKDLNLTNAENSLQNNDITPSAINIEYVSELAKCDDVIEDTINRNISMDRVIGETLNNSNELNVVHNNIVNDTANNLELEKSILLRTRVITRSVYKDLKHDKVNEALDTIKTEKEMSTAELEHTSETFGNKSHNDHNIPKDVILNDESSVLSDRSNVEVTRSEDHNNSEISGGTIAVPRSPSPRDINEMKNARNIQEETCVNNKAIKIQAIETQNKKMNQRNKKMELIFVPHNFEESQTPMSRLYKYINKKKCTKKHKSRKEIEYACKITDKFVKKQLQRLMNSDWKDSIYDSIHDDIKVKLENICGPRIIAKCIVEFIIEEVDHTEALDKSFTPPAPLMTKFEQKIITLLFDLEASKPMMIYFVQAAIEFHMFRLNSDVKDPIDSLTRIYVVLSRIQKDREKIRIMCCSALYCMNLKSIAVLNTILTCWYKFDASLTQ